MPVIWYLGDSVALLIKSPFKIKSIGDESHLSEIFLGNRAQKLCKLLSRK